MNIIERRNHLQRIYNKYASDPVNRKLKHWCISLGLICILLILSGIYFIDKDYWTALLLTRGCAGICGCVIFVLAAIYFYRCHMLAMKDKDYWHRDR